MMSRQVVTVAVLAGLLVASPALAQRQRNPGGDGGSRGGGGGRPSVSRDGGGGRPSGGRSYGQPQQRQSAPQVSRPSAGPRGGSGRYAAPRGDGGRGYYQSARPATPQYSRPGYGVRGDRGRPAYAPRPGYSARSGYYGRPGYAARPGYAVPRAYVSPRAYSYGYYGRPRYVAPGWRGPWSYSVISPRFIYPRVLGFGYWQPYYYRPSIGVGVYYGDDGLYPFGTVPTTYYDPTPGVTYGGLRITDAPRDAQVFADDNYVGIVDDFDGVFQHLNLEAGPHRIEIHSPGLTPIAFDVEIPPGQTVTLRAEMR
ncbi:MAG: hypothetical protein IT182_00910 [Acidobacteria bacterium]|nr:hypothetical protein [Acidobacteriota bacterium]